MNDERYVVKDETVLPIVKSNFLCRWPGRTYREICSGCWVGCVFTVNEPLRPLNRIEPRPPLPGGPFLVVFFHNRLQLLGLHMWTWIEPKGLVLELLGCESTLNLMQMALGLAKPVNSLSLRHSEVGMWCHCMKCLRFLFKPRQLSLLDFGTFSRPLLLQLRDDLVRCVFFPQGPQVLRCQRGAISLHNEPAGMSHARTQDQQQSSSV